MSDTFGLKAVIYKDDAAWQLVDELERLGYDSKKSRAYPHVTIYSDGGKRIAEYSEKGGRATMLIEEDLVRKLGFGFLRGTGLGGRIVGAGELSNSLRRTLLAITPDTLDDYLGLGGQYMAIEKAQEDLLDFAQKSNKTFKTHWEVLDAFKKSRRKKSSVYQPKVSSTRVASKGTLREAMAAYERAVINTLLTEVKRVPFVYRAKIGTNFIALEMEDFDGLEASEWMIEVSVSGKGTTVSYWRQEAPFVNGKGKNPHTVDTYGYSSDTTVGTMVRDMRNTLATRRF